ncbi:MAG: rRNA maturation RNase YbeY [Chitinophagales bacterium]|nr:rRNA maturation RNase YbeY [Chitinophagales bacterium]
MPVTFHLADVKFSLKHKKELKAFILKRLGSFTPSNINLSFVFCSDEYLLNINRQFLNHDYYTDIITFPLSEQSNTLEGEIYISIHRVKENSAKYSKPAHRSSLIVHPFEKELHRVLFHGILHLLGYKDKTPAQKAKMRTAEDQWLKAFAQFMQKEKTKRMATQAKQSHK